MSCQPLEDEVGKWVEATQESCTGHHMAPREAIGQNGTVVAPIERGCFQAVEAHAFAHPAEQDLARILSFYRIRWVYEPTTFHLEVREDGRPAEQITPDFYLPDHDLFIELTTMRQRLVTRKNRKIRRLREIFPALQIKLLYRRDYDRLVGSYPAPDQYSRSATGHGPDRRRRPAARECRSLRPRSSNRAEA